MSTRSLKNLEAEVESIMSQDETDSDKDQRRSKTPTRNVKFLGVHTPKAVLQDIQTPRRSCRKSVKPAQDYEEIINKSLRHCNRSAKETLISENDENNDNQNLQPKWTPAKVGRSSEKRTRKSKRSVRGKAQYRVVSEDVEEDTVNIEKVDKTLQPFNDKLQEIDHLVRHKEIIGEVLVVQKENDIVDSMQSFNVNPEDSNNQNKEIKGSNIEKGELNQSVQLLQEDSEATPESTDKSDQEEICIIYEKNIGNLEVKSNENNIQSKSFISISSEEEDGFGSYLKSKVMNISDLGLNPISQDEEIGQKYTTQEVEEMPSLIIWDDEDEAENPSNTKNLNETFEADKNEDEVNKCLKQNEDTMEALQLSDEDCETPKKRVRIVLTDTKEQTITLLSSNKKSSVRPKILSTPKRLSTKMPGTPKQSMQGSVIKTKLPITPKLPNASKPITPKFTSSQLPSTSKQEKKKYRFPTPYKRGNLTFDDEFKENMQNTPSKELPNSTLIAITTLEPKQIVLRGIRKRSLSLCINEQPYKHLLAGPIGKEKKNRMVSFHSPANQTTIIDDLDVVIAESVKKCTFQKNETPNKYITTRRKRSMSFDDSIMSTSMSSKLPRPVPGQNALKMQCSALFKNLKRTKLPNFAAIHENQFNKMENLVDHVNRKQERSKNLINSATKLFSASIQKNKSITKNNSNISGTKPTALRKIDLNPRSQNTEKVNLITKAAPPKKPAFNLSTSLKIKPTVFATNIAEKANTSYVNNEKKVSSRLQRHMELFKGRSPLKRAGLTPRKNEAILRGVRSNRRFELQMQHRRNLEQ